MYHSLYSVAVPNFYLNLFVCYISCYEKESNNVYCSIQVYLPLPATHCPFQSASADSCKQTHSAVNLFFSCIDENFIYISE